MNSKINNMQKLLVPCTLPSPMITNNAIFAPSASHHQTSYLVQFSSFELQNLILCRERKVVRNEEKLVTKGQEDTYNKLERKRGWGGEKSHGVE